MASDRSAAKSHGLAGHERRLRAALRKILLLSLAGPAAANAACGWDDGTQVPLLDASGVDATLPDSSGPDAGSALDASAPLDAGEAGIADAPDPFTTCVDGGLVGPGYFSDAGGLQCYYFVELSCPTYPLQAQASGCYLPGDVCATLCALHAAYDCSYTPESCSLVETGDAAVWQLAEAGPYTVACGICAGVGRRPTGLRKARAAASPSAIGAHFARASHLEAASVVAFQRVARELRAYGAPRALIRAAERAECDEVRHARTTARLARKHGAIPAAPRVAPGRSRSLEAVARENAVEGCVRETFGAMVATWQAAHAEDAEVCRAMARIAVDETRHAALAWAIAEWADRKLDRAARARVARAKQAALRELARELAAAQDAETVRAAGVPGRDEALRLFGRMAASVWAG